MGQGGNKTQRVDIIDSYDPRVTGRAAQKGTFFRYIPGIGSPVLLVKTDDGFSINWSPVGGGGGGAVTYDSVIQLMSPVEYGASGANYDLNFASQTTAGSDLTYTAGGAGGSDIVTVNTTGFYLIDFYGRLNDSSLSSGSCVMGVTINRAPSTTEGLEGASMSQIAAISTPAQASKSYILGNKIVYLTAGDVLRFVPDISFADFNLLEDFVLTIERIADPQIEAS